MTILDLKARLEVVEIVVRILAFLAAGVWAVIGLKYLRHREKALADIRNVDAETAKIALDTRLLEQKLREAATLQIAIGTSSHDDTEGRGFLLLVTVEITNVGTTLTRLDWKAQAPPVSVRRVRFNDDGIPRFDDSALQVAPRMTANPSLEAFGTIIRIGATEVLPFALRVPEAGLYLVSFRAAIEGQDQSASENASTSSARPVSWTRSMYVLVPEPADA